MKIALHIIICDFLFTLNTTQFSPGKVLNESGRKRLLGHLLTDLLVNYSMFVWYSHHLLQRKAPRNLTLWSLRLCPKFPTWYCHTMYSMLPFLGKKVSIVLEWFAYVLNTGKVWQGRDLNIDFQVRGKVIYKTDQADLLGDNLDANIPLLPPSPSSPSSPSHPPPPPQFPITSKLQVATFLSSWKEQELRKK
jgi:hypothetical protein